MTKGDRSRGEFEHGTRSYGIFSHNEGHYEFKHISIAGSKQDALEDYLHYFEDDYANTVNKETMNLL